LLGSARQGSSTVSASAALTAGKRSLASESTWWKLGTKTSAATATSPTDARRPPSSRVASCGAPEARPVWRPGPRPQGGRSATPPETPAHGRNSGRKGPRRRGREPQPRHRASCRRTPCASVGARPAPSVRFSGALSSKMSRGARGCRVPLRGKTGGRSEKPARARGSRCNSANASG
jgi:hypothetical protein